MDRLFIDENGRARFPMRKVAEEAGIQVDFIAETQHIQLSDHGHPVKLQTGSNQMAIGGGLVKEVDTVAAISDACVYIPARVVFEALGYDVR